MQKATAMIRLSGSLLHTVRKKNLTPPEIVVLKRIHGGDAITSIKATREGFKVRTADELERLELRYGAAMIRECFPGHTPVLPKTFKEIGINITKETRRTEAAEELDAAMQEEDENDAEDENLSDEELASLFGKEIAQD